MLRKLEDNRLGFRQIELQCRRSCLSIIYFRSVRRWCCYTLLYNANDPLDCAIRIPFFFVHYGTVTPSWQRSFFASLSHRTSVDFLAKTIALPHSLWFPYWQMDAISSVRNNSMVVFNRIRFPKKMMILSKNWPIILFAYVSFCCEWRRFGQCIQRVIRYRIFLRDSICLMAIAFENTNRRYEDAEIWPPTKDAIDVCGEFKSRTTIGDLRMNVN